MLGNRAIYHRGWKAVTYHGTAGMIYDGVTDPMKPFDEDIWELYHVENDFSESTDLAGEHPEKLRELQEIWWIEAARNNVLPITGAPSGGAGRPRPTGRRKRFVYYPGGAPIDVAVAANTKNRSHSVTADVEVPSEGAEGVLVALGTRFGGYVLYMKDGKLKYAYNFLGRFVRTVESDRNVPAGQHLLAASFEKTGAQPFGAGGTVRLFVDGEQTAEMALPFTIPFLAGIGESLQVGYDLGATVSDEYESPFRFTGTLHRVVVDIAGHEPPRDLAQEAAIAMARQ
jgi:arylsulfatase